MENPKAIANSSQSQNPEVNVTLNQTKD